jgi:hypothetical protein
MENWFTNEELDRIKREYSHRMTDIESPKQPYAIRGVLNTQLSIARYYGGITYNGARYIYTPQTDELIRDDVFAKVLKWRKEAAKLQRAEDRRQAKWAQRELLINGGES